MNINQSNCSVINWKINTMELRITVLKQDISLETIGIPRENLLIFSSSSKKDNVYLQLHSVEKFELRYQFSDSVWIVFKFTEPKPDLFIALIIELNPQANHILTF